MNRSQNRNQRYVPLLLSIGIAVADQITKLLVLNRIPPLQGPGTMVPVIGRFLSFVRVQNLGIAFSLGDSVPPIARQIFFVLVPLAIMTAVILYILRSDEPTALQRWALAGVVGGGLGNLVDRIFRDDGVVDFILVRMYGLFGLEFFPVFNLADAAITCSGILLIVSVLFARPTESPTT